MAMQLSLILLLSFCGSAAVLALDNGLILTPPMGWLSWERYRCTVDCTKYPDDCISEKLFRDMADRIVSDGYHDVGYEYVMIDDCWQAKTRDAQGRLQPDPDRFPSGIRALADYIHGKGLKFGIYADIGYLTCEGYPGSEYHFEIDAQTFANWTVDFLKLDGCYYDMDKYYLAYPTFGYYLNKTGRPIAYHCDWPCYQEYVGKQPDYKMIAKYCNTWRNCHDMDDSWDSLLSIIECEGADKTHFVEVAGPGNFNDADMLLIGDFGISYDQERLQMAIWSIIASPLIMSNNLRDIRPASKALLLNKRAIAISQDKMGIPGRLIKTIGDIHVWTRAILPTGSFAFAFMNKATAVPSVFSIQLSVMGFKSPSGYNVTEVFDNQFIGIFKPTDTIKVSVNPTGVFFGQAVEL